MNNNTNNNNMSSTSLSTRTCETTTTTRHYPQRQQKLRKTITIMSSSSSRCFGSTTTILFVLMISFVSFLLDLSSSSQQQQQDFLFVMAAPGAMTRTSVGSSGSSSTLLYGPPISLSRLGINKFISLRWERGRQLANLEQQVEDYNADYIATSSITSNGGGMGLTTKHRRLICLPILDETLFNPPIGVFSHDHLQTGDKVCLPSNFWQSIQYNNAQVPWLFSIKRIDGITSPSVQLQETIKKVMKKVDKDEKQKKKLKRKKDDNDHQEEKGTEDNEDEEEEDDDIIISEYLPMESLNEIIAGPLDFRSPSNYIFVPLWMMRSLRLRPYDVVDVSLIETVPAGSLAKLRPLTSDFSTDLIKNGGNPRTILESELRHYSSLTKGSTIAFDYNKKRYWFEVSEIRSAPKGTKEKYIKVQDCDIATDFLQSKEMMNEKRKKKKLVLQQKKLKLQQQQKLLNEQIQQQQQQQQQEED